MTEQTTSLNVDSSASIGLNRRRMDVLAIDGGTPIRKAPMSPWPYFDAELIERATQPLRSGKVNYWTGGEGRAFEQELAESIGVRHAIVLANGTLALEAALEAVGLGAGDEFITTSRTFIASASAGIRLGGIPKFADVDLDTQNITAASVADQITDRTKAIVAVHLAGYPCDIEAIQAVAAKRGIPVIEDCAQAHGAKIRGRSVGSIGTIAAWSYCQDKILTTGGEGGAVTTNDRELWARMWSLKDHGKSFEAVYERQHPPGFRWLHEGFGSNWRLTEMQSALGRVLLRRLDEWVDRRRANAAYLTERFSGHAALRIPVVPADVHHAYYKYYVFVRPEALRDGWTRDRVMSAIAAEGVPCFSGSCSEIYLEKAFTSRNLAPAQRLPNARELGETSLMFLVHPTLTSEEMEQTADAVEKVLSVATA